ncbi:MAG TPA: nitronate monooxygenase [Puia sp.]|nr:nitronate monooxygenase [Puia sp.]
MWYDTAATKILGSQYPIMQGPFGGGLSSVELTAAVSNLGGIGGYGVYTFEPDEIIRVNHNIRKATNKPYNINIWISDTDTMPEKLIDDRFEKAKALFRTYFDELGIGVPEKPIIQKSRYENQVQTILDIRPPIFSFSFGIPSADILDQCRKKNIVTAGSATTAEEAMVLEAAGVDLVIASGFEAGGHRPSFLASAESSLVGSFVLVQQIKDRVSIPVIAAGGIASGKGIAAALALGADGVQIGTAFLACEESAAPSFHRNLLFSDAAKHTVLSRAFTGRLGRGLANRITVETNGRETAFLPFPSQSRFTGTLREAAIERKKWDLIFVWGGQIASLLKHRRAADLMKALISETNTFFAEGVKRKA